MVLNMVREAKRLTGSRYLCLAGGVALNCVANGRILKSGLFDDIWIQPAAGDAGGALGAAYCAHHILLNNPREADGKTDRMKGSYLGPEYSDERIRKVARRYRAPFRHYESFGLLCDEVAGLLDAAKVVGWYQGRMEWGPRALGNRSILADARDPEMQKKLNLKVKFREGFRPFAPSVLIEEVGAYFDVETPSPYRLLIADVREERRKALPEGYGSQGWRGEAVPHPLGHSRRDAHRFLRSPADGPSGDEHPLLGIAPGVQGSDAVRSALQLQCPGGADRVHATSSSTRPGSRRGTRRATGETVLGWTSPDYS